MRSTRPVSPFLLAWKTPGVAEASALLPLLARASVPLAAPAVEALGWWRNDLTCTLRALDADPFAPPLLLMAPR